MDFSKQISEFTSLGVYPYKFDSVENVVVNSSSTDFSSNHLSLPLEDVNYDRANIEAFYNVNFEEFIPSEETEVGGLASQNVIAESEELTNVKSENEELKARLAELTAASEENTTEAERQATKDVIIELRKALEQGKSDSDFSESFPYTPLTQ